MEPTEIFLTLQSDLVCHNRKRIVKKEPVSETLYDKADIGELFYLTLEDGTELGAYADEIVPIHFYQIDIVRYDEYDTPVSDYPVCIRGVFKPSEYEAKDFIRDNYEKIGSGCKLFICELSYKQAMDFFGIGYNGADPIFGLDFNPKCWERYFEKNP